MSPSVLCTNTLLSGGSSIRGKTSSTFISVSLFLIIMVSGLGFLPLLLGNFGSAALLFGSISSCSLESTNPLSLSLSLSLSSGLRSDLFGFIDFFFLLVDLCLSFVAGAQVISLTLTSLVDGAAVYCLDFSVFLVCFYIGMGYGFDGLILDEWSVVFALHII